MTDIVTINQFQNQVIIDSTTNNVEVSAVGQQGIAGGAVIGNKPVVITSVQDLDVLQFAQSSDAWVNRPQSNLTDGGNF